MIRAALVLPLLLLPANANAWWDGGHMTIAAAAWSQLEPNVKKRAGTILKLNPDYKRWIASLPSSTSDDEKARTAFIMASLWPDDIKKEASYLDDGDDPAVENSDQNIGYEDRLMHKYWHYIDIPFSTDGTELVQPEAPNAETQILEFRRTLKSKLADDHLKSYDLVWLIHIVGDIHQPLHATSRFSSDLDEGDIGGNAVGVSCKDCARDHTENLHSYWDSLLGSGLSSDQAVAAAAALPAADAAKAMRTRPHGWIVESFDLAKLDVYAPPIGDGKGPFDLDGANDDQTRYHNAALNDAKAQAALAGARLAKLLNDNLR